MSGQGTSRSGGGNLNLWQVFRIPVCVAMLQN